MAEYWPRSFFAFLLTSTSSRPKVNAKKQLSHGPANLTSRLVNNAHVCGMKYFHSIYMSHNRAVVRLEHFIKGSVRLKLYYTIVIYIIPCSVGL